MAIVPGAYILNIHQIAGGFQGVAAPAGGLYGSSTLKYRKQSSEGNFLEATRSHSSQWTVPGLNSDELTEPNPKESKMTK